MNNTAPPEAVRSALHEATRSLLAVLDKPHLSVAEIARLRATAMLQNALVLTDPYLPDNPIVYANPAFLELSGYPEDRIVGFNCRFLQGPSTDRVEVARLKEAIKTERPVQVTLLNYRRDGTTFWNELTVAPVHDEQGGLTHFVAVQTDVTALKESGAALLESKAALLESEQRLWLALESGRLGTWDLNLSTNKYLHLSALWRGHFGLAPDVVVTNAEVFQAVHPGDRDRLRRALQQAVATHQDYQAEYRVVWPDGSVHWISSHATPTYTEAGEPLRLVGMTQEITARKEQEAAMVRALQEAEERADHDPLTGLPNHRVFQRRLAEEAARAQREGTMLAVVMLDVDDFKFFNGVYGHTTGDEVLRQVAERLQGACRPYDTVARFGGDEFALLLPNVGATSAAEIEARLRADLAGLAYGLVGQETPVPITVSLPIIIPISISVGASLLPQGDLNGSAVVRLADARLLRSKTGGESETEADRVRAQAGRSLSGFSMLDALVTAVDNKDRYTRRHSEDVMEYSLLIARGLGMGAEEQRTVSVAALLHDVGKIGVPDAVLRKPGKLSEEEFAAVKQHPTMGAAIVSTVPGLEDTLDAVRHHHERWDGGGYPSGLRGEETPLIARLMAVADAFSAMTMDRPYRTGMIAEKALAILKEGAGAQWDPECVRAFLVAMRAAGGMPLPPTDVPMAQH